jgi:branched-chain amino acid transport system substrate-binding protein
MKKHLWLQIFMLVCLILLATLVAGCATDEPAADEPAAGEGAADEADETVDLADTEPIVIGCTLPLSGPFAETGVYVRDGYEFWVEEINAGGGLLGRRVELVIIDDQSDAAQAVAQMETLISQRNVDLLIGGYPGTSAAAQMAVAEQHGKVYVSMGGHMTSFVQGFNYSFGAPPLMGEWWYVGFFDYLKTLPQEEWPTKAAMITVNNAVGQSVRTSAITALTEMGIEIVVDELYDLPLAAAEPLVNKAKIEGADLFLANGFFADGVQAIRAIKALDYQPKAILQGIGSLVPAWEDELGEDGNYVFSGTAIHPGLPFEGVDYLNEVSQEKYGTMAPAYFMFGCAWMQVLQQGVEGAGSLDQDEIRDWLRANQVSNVGGDFTFDEKGLPPAYSFGTQVIDGVPYLVWPEDVAMTAPVYPYPYE